MDYDSLANPIETVSLIPIYTYFSLLSDFLFSENYLSIDDRQSQIPVVNGLYKYFDERPNNTEDLIRSLLQGSDLYGEKIGESVDETFVNAMFDYIISSLVFSKFGNIYGFLAEVVRKTDSLLIDNILQNVKISLSLMVIQSENGDRSMLTPLAVDRIFNDIISPLFPKSKNPDHRLLSLDYIYAQAGSNLLQPGRMNATYYSNEFTEKNKIDNKETLFDEYLLIGHLLEELIIAEKVAQLNVTAFALPALFVYVINEKKTLEQEKTINIIYDPQHWLRAYNTFLLHLDKIYSKIESYLKVDAKYNLHFALSNYKTLSSLTKYYTTLDPDCQPENINTENKCANISEKIQSHFNHNIDNIIYAYKTFDTKSINNAFDNYFPSTVRNLKVNVKLMNMDFVHYKLKEYLNFSNIFEIYYPNGTARYFSIKRENYQAKIKRNFQFRLFLDKTTRSPDDKTRSSFTQQLNSIRDKIVQEKSKNLKELLMTNQSLNADWWKEYGFTLVPFYPYLSGKIDNITDSEVDTLTFYSNENNEKISLYLLEENTKSNLTSTGTTIRALNTKKLLTKIIEEEKVLKFEIYADYLKYSRLSKFTNDAIEFYQRSLIRFSMPLNNILLKKNELLTVLKENINRVKILTNLSYQNVLNLIENIMQYIMTIIIFSKSDSNDYERKINVLSQTSLLDSNFGYKFVTLNDYNIAILRTIDYYSGPRKVLLLQNNTDSPNEKIYRIINSTNLKPTNEYLYEIDNRLQKFPHSFQFDSIDVADFNLNDCNSKNKVTIKKCLRRTNKENQKWMASYVYAQCLYEMTNMTKLQTKNIIDNYVFPEDEDFNTTEFIQNWIREKDLLSPKYAKRYIIPRKEVLFKLRYSEWLEEDDLQFSEMKERIKKIYTPEQRNLIEAKTTLQAIFDKYKSDNQRFVATFDDYYAIRNFATTGYRRIKSDNDEAKRMKIALYKLAIRQSDDPPEKFDTILCVIESFSEKSVQKLFFEQSEYTLQKFTITSPRIVNKVTYHREGFVNVMFRMIFANFYFRGKIHQKNCFLHTRSILLPGARFKIKRAEYINVTGLGYILRVRLEYMYEDNEIYSGYKRIMKSIAEIDL
ncbi:uncharacterized protein LOC122500173 [Leptopilina heterotoma]|uniref:uncharacterized protein LOC122500173 n=1 Tax=Leptopilina heterotoma TaxID=63436 RepID=UPI001CAA264E|nr:uncharacterized protein LOC122500173 [Leptopilina heterotoma]